MDSSGVKVMRSHLGVNTEVTDTDVDTYTHLLDNNISNTQ